MRLLNRPVGEEKTEISDPNRNPTPPRRLKSDILRERREQKLRRGLQKLQTSLLAGGWLVLFMCPGLMMVLTLVKGDENIDRYDVLLFAMTLAAGVSILIAARLFRQALEPGGISWRHAALLFLFLAPLPALGAYSVWSKLVEDLDERARVQAAFAVSLPKYRSMYNLERETKRAAYIAGKTVVVNVFSGETRALRKRFFRGVEENVSLDLDYGGLPARLHASEPDEVETVILIRWATAAVGRYGASVGRYVGPGNPALKISCEVIVIDSTRGVIVGERSFSGGDPPSSIPRSADAGFGSMPPFEEYIQALPRR